MTIPLWKQILRKNFIRWEVLADFLNLNESQREHVLQKSHFPLNVPLRLAEKMEKGTLEDPILRQFLPLKDELKQSMDFLADPVKDAHFRQETKLLRKYEGRVLLLVTGACAMNCRYCFRQNFDYDISEKTFLPEIALIREDSSIREVILSGGDPLSLSDSHLKPLLKSLSEIPHVSRIRFHTRFPMGIPERIDSHFLSLVESIPKQIWFVIHSNHPNEFDQDIFDHLRSLQKRGVVILNQAVLLKGVNDDALTLQRHCELLADHGILPYYLHQLDRVQGAAHFEVSEEEGLALIKKVSEKVSGYAVPKYVREIPGKLSKTIL